MHHGASNLLFAAFGPSWRAKAPAALGYSRRTVQRWAAGTVCMPVDVRQRLERLLATAAQSRAIERWRSAEHQRVDELAEEWTAAASNAMTQLRRMAIEDGRSPRSRGGRPRKRPRSAVGPTPIPAARVRPPPAPRAAAAYRLVPAASVGR
jgi:hypothetical protein